MRFLLPVAALLMLSACASSGPLYRDAVKGYPPIAKDSGRLYLYREARSFAAGIQPSVMVDGRKVRDSVPGSYTMLDLAPGDHVVSVSTEVEKSVNVKILSKQETYVREAPTVGILIWRVYVEPVSKETAQNELTELHEINTPTVSEVKE